MAILSPFYRRPSSWPKVRLPTSSVKRLLEQRSKVHLYILVTHIKGILPYGLNVEHQIQGFLLCLCSITNHHVRLLSDLLEDTTFR